MTPTDLQSLVDDLAARAGPGEQVEAYAARHRTTMVRAYQQEVETLEQAETAGVGIRVFTGGREGFASAGTLDPEAVGEALDAARENAGFALPDDDSGPADPDGLVPPALDLFRDDLAATPTEVKVGLALELERAVKAADPRVTGVRAAEFGDRAGETAVAASTGVAASWASTSCHLVVQALASDDGDTRIATDVGIGRTLADLSVEDVAREAAVRATRILGARKAKTQRVTVVLEPRVTSAVLGILGAALSGEAVVKGRSPFADRVGDTIAAPAVTLVDDPTDPRSLAAAPCDAEGLASRRTTLLDAGTLRGFLHHSWSARKAGMASTASAVRGYASTPVVAPRALWLAPGDLSLDALVATVGDGFLVQSGMGIHSGANPVSGDFSVGAEGLMIRGGVLAEPVCEVTIASALQRMLLDVVEVGADLEWLPGGTAAPSLAIQGVVLSGD